MTEQVVDHDVVVVIDAGWVCLEQIACSLRRHGIDVCWISIGLSREAGVRRRLTVPGALNLPDASGLRGALAPYAHRRVLDVLCPEHHLALVTGLTEELGFEPALVDELRRRVAWGDKLVAGERLRAAGVPVPNKVDLSEISVDGAIAKLGLPVVIKGRVGAGGDAVVVAHTAEAAWEAREQLEARGFSLFAEEFLEGEAGQYAAAYLPGGRITQEVTYVSRRARELGPPVGAVSVDAPRLVEVGRGALAAVGGFGLANVETVQLRDGRQLVIDLNLRPWGTFMSWREVGVDFMRGYLEALGVLPEPTEVQRVAPGCEVDVFPSASKIEAQRGVGPGLADFLRTGSRYARWVGPRYAAMTAIAFAKYLLIGEPSGTPGVRVGGLKQARAQRAQDVAR